MYINLLYNQLVKQINLKDKSMKLKTVANIITIPIIALTMTHASNVDAFTPCGLDETLNYNTMTTQQIQFEVEKHSTNGDLPFELGLELIKRWTTN